MNDATPSYTEPTGNPWLVALFGGAVAGLAAGLLIFFSNQPEHPPALTPHEQAGQVVGLALIGVGGMLLAGWLVAAAICWQLARNAAT